MVKQFFKIEYILLYQRLLFLFTFSYFFFICTIVNSISINAVFIPNNLTSIAFAKQSPAHKWVYTVEIREDFDTAVEFLKSSIQEEGLTIANVGHVALMLARTKDAVVGATLIYNNADIYQFCSSKLGYKLFALGPDYIGACPLNIFAYELKTKPGIVFIGFRLPPLINIKPVNEQNKQARLVFLEIYALLKRIADRAVE